MSVSRHYQAILASPVGPLGLVIDPAGRVIQLDFLSAATALQAPTSSAAKRVAWALETYFEDPRAIFEVPLAGAGTVYQQRVWQALREIPVGRVHTYGALARRLRSAPRAVGQACRRNPIPILVPCHRVVARDGAGGFSGHTEGPSLAIKRWLLAHEGVQL